MLHGDEREDFFGILEWWKAIVLWWRLLLKSMALLRLNNSQCLFSRITAGFQLRISQQASFCWDLCLHPPSQQLNHILPTGQRRGHHHTWPPFMTPMPADNSTTLAFTWWSAAYRWLIREFIEASAVLFAGGLLERSFLSQFWGVLLWYGIVWMVLQAIPHHDYFLRFDKVVDWKGNPQEKTATMSSSLFRLVFINVKSILVLCASKYLPKISPMS